MDQIPGISKDITENRIESRNMSGFPPVQMYSSRSKGRNSARTINAPFVVLPSHMKAIQSVVKKDDVILTPAKRKLHEPKERKMTWEERKKLGAKPNLMMQPKWLSDVKEKTKMDDQNQTEPLDSIKSEKTKTFQLPLKRNMVWKNKEKLESEPNLMIKPQWNSAVLGKTEPLEEESNITEIEIHERKKRDVPANSSINPDENSTQPDLREMKKNIAAPTVVNTKVPITAAHKIQNRAPLKKMDTAVPKKMNMESRPPCWKSNVDGKVSLIPSNITAPKIIPVKKMPANPCNIRKVPVDVAPKMTVKPLVSKFTPVANRRIISSYAYKPAPKPKNIITEPIEMDNRPPWNSSVKPWKTVYKTFS